MSSAARRRRRRALREAARCSHCRSVVRRVAFEGQGLDGQFFVAHDESCPWWQAQGAKPFSQLRMVKVS
jgi:hypothetical protein